jgi:hypothetical protein
MTRKWQTVNGEIQRVPGTENEKLTLGEQIILQPELNLITKAEPTQPTLPGFENLPTTKPKPKDLSYGGYIDREQRLYENLNMPGYGTPEKSNVSYKKLKDAELLVDKANKKSVKQLTDLKNFGKSKYQEKATYPYDTPKGINWATKIMKEESAHTLSPKENKDIDILNKEMKLSSLKGEIKGIKKYDNLDPTTYPSDPEQRRRLKNIADLEKDLGYVQKENNVPYQNDTRSPVQKKRDKFNLWSEIKKDKSYGNLKDVRKIVNDEYKKHGTKNLTPDEHKYLDKKSKPVYPEVIFRPEPEISSSTFKKEDRPVEQIVRELADARLVREQKEWDRRYGKFGITQLKRPE